MTHQQLFDRLLPEDHRADRERLLYGVNSLLGEHRWPMHRVLLHAEYRHIPRATLAAVLVDLSRDNPRSTVQDLRECGAVGRDVLRYVRDCVGQHREWLYALDGIRSLRTITGWTLDEVARIAGVSRRTVEGWEQGRRVPAPCQMLIDAAVARR